MIECVLHVLGTMAPQNIPCAIVLTLGNIFVL